MIRKRFARACGTNNTPNRWMLPILLVRVSLRRMERTWREITLMIRDHVEMLMIHIVVFNATL
jgi:hypothetical protein